MVVLAYYCCTFFWSVSEKLCDLSQPEIISEKCQELYWGLMVIVVTYIPIFLLFLYSKLYTEISSKWIAVRFFPLQKLKVYTWDDLEKVYVRQYKPILEYGGWGLRGMGSNRALNVSGNWGMQLVFKNGKKLLIGTKNPAEIENVLKKISIEVVSKKTIID